MRRVLKIGICLWLGIWLGIFPLLPLLAQGQDLIVVVDDILLDRYAAEQIIQVYVTVRHPQLGAVEDLGPEDFTLTVSGGQPFVPDGAEIRDDAVVSMAVVLELYESMRGDPLDDAKAAIKHLCTTKPPQDRVALFSVRRDVDPDSEMLDDAYEYGFTEDGGAVDNFAQNLQVVSGGRGTPLYDTVVRALRITAEVSKEPVGRRAVVVITDGGDVNSRYNDQTVIDIANGLKVPVYAIGYTGQNRSYDQSLNEIANRTGGGYQNTPDSADFKAFLDDVRQTMSKHYLLTFNAGALSGGRQILDVRVDTSGMVGTTSRVFEVGGTTPEETAPPATTMPEPSGEVVATPEEVPSTPPTGEGEDVTFSIARWLKNNFWFVLLGVGLLLIVLAVIIFLVTRRRRLSSSSWPSGGESDYYTPTPVVGPEYMPYGSEPPFNGETAPRDGAWGPPSSGPALASQTEINMGKEPTRPQPTFPPQPAQGEPLLQEHTMVLDRGPKLPRAMLVARDSQEQYPVDQAVVGIGRASENQVKLIGERISRRHATIKIESGEFRIYDLGSANGTFVNEERVRDPVVLQDGDVVRLGDAELTFKLVT